jgi:D-amino-acid dehydrogenase
MDKGLRLGGTVEFGGLDGPEDWSRAKSILDQARHLFPNLPPSHSSEAEMRLWSGHRPCLPDSLPVIGPSPHHANVFFAFGHGHLGLTGAAVTARAMSALLARRPPGMDLAPFRVDRFSRL